MQFLYSQNRGRNNESEKQKGGVKDVLVTGAWRWTSIKVEGFQLAGRTVVDWSKTRGPWDVHCVCSAPISDSAPFHAFISARKRQRFSSMPVKSGRACQQKLDFVYMSY